MSLAFRQFKVYLRVALIALIGTGVALILFKNRGYSVGFWFFWLRDERQPINVVYLMLCTAGGTLVSWWVLSIARGLFRDWRELNRLKARAALDRAHAKREAELTEREKRLAEKELDAGAGTEGKSPRARDDRPGPDGDEDDAGEEAV